MRGKLVIPNSDTVGLFIMPVVIFLVAGFLMVQVRSVTGPYPSGDWPRDGFTWHFYFLYALGIVGWGMLSVVYKRIKGNRFLESANVVGIANAPLLGLVAGWSWYGLTGPQFHLPECTTPIICHDVAWWSTYVWVVPFLLWGSYSLLRAYTE